MPDGRMAFLDFGLFKVMVPKELKWSSKRELACQRAGHEGETTRSCTGSGRRPA